MAKAVRAFFIFRNPSEQFAACPRVRRHCLMCGVNPKLMSLTETVTEWSDKVFIPNDVKNLPDSSTRHDNKTLPSFWMVGVIMQTLPPPKSCRLWTPSETSTTPKSKTFWCVAVVSGECLEQPANVNASKASAISDVCIFMFLCQTAVSRKSCAP